MPRMAWSRSRGGRLSRHKFRGSFTCESAETKPLISVIDGPSSVSAHLCAIALGHSAQCPGPLAVGVLVARAGDRYAGAGRDDPSSVVAPAEPVPVATDQHRARPSVLVAADDEEITLGGGGVGVRLHDGSGGNR